MSLRDALNSARASHDFVVIEKPVSKHLQISGALKKLEPSPVLFTQVEGSDFDVVGNLFCQKKVIAEYFGIPVEQIIPKMVNAIGQREPCKRVEKAACQEVIDLHPNLDQLPILRHCEQDGGAYISAGVVVAKHSKWGQNLDFHRLMQFSSTELAVRVVRNRHFDAFLRDLGEVEVAVCIGAGPNVLLAAATSVERGVDELEIANALEPLSVVKAKTVDLWVPAECEFVLEGKVYLSQTHAEGPFVDLTETYDVVREEPVLVVQAITHRKNAIWQALLPGGLEHKLLMGMPREPTIFKKVNEVVRCLDVYINPGGCSWLHAIVKIHKKHEDDGRKAIAAAFEGHKSCKHVFVVDDDIDIYNPLEVEWATATRFQADRDLVIIGREPGSSLDPSSDPGSHLTAKVGFDLTKPLQTHGKSFNRAKFPDVDLTALMEK